MFGLDSARKKLRSVLRIVLFHGVRLFHVAAINELASNERFCELSVAKIVVVFRCFVRFLEILDDDVVDLFEHLLSTFF